MFCITTLQIAQNESEIYSYCTPSVQFQFSVICFPVGKDTKRSTFFIHYLSSTRNLLHESNEKGDKTSRKICSTKLKVEKLS